MFAKCAACCSARSECAKLDFASTPLLGPEDCFPNFLASEVAQEVVPARQAVPDPLLARIESNSWPSECGMHIGKSLRRAGCEEFPTAGSAG